jgi:hypothetical protein
MSHLHVCSFVVEFVVVLIQILWFIEISAMCVEGFLIVQCRFNGGYNPKISFSPPLSDFGDGKSMVPIP